MAGKWIQERELRILAGLKQSSAFSETQRDSLETVDRRLILKGSRPATRVRFAAKAKHLARYLKKPFEEATRQDLEGFLSARAQVHDAEQMRLVKSWLRRFYAVLLSPYDEETLPEVVSWIRVHRVRASHKAPKPVFKPEEVKELIRACGSVRDRAIIATLYESGARISELCGVSIGEVEFDDYGARILVDGKTGVRKIRLIQSVPELRDWLNDHAWNTDPAAPLFIREATGSSPIPLLQEAVRKILLRAAKRAGISKHPNPHAFRRSRATELSQDLTPSELSVLHGWVQGSRMPQVYIHLAGEDVERKLLQRAGIIPKQEARNNPLAPRNCPRCGTQNPAANRNCGKCALILDERLLRAKASEQEKLMEKVPALLRVLEDPEVARLIVRKIGAAATEPNAKVEASSSKH